MRILEQHHKPLTRIYGSPMMKEVVPVDLNEIAQWYFGDSKQVHIAYRGDFVGLVSPWPTAFFEYRMPAVWHTIDEHGKPIAFDFGFTREHRVGLMVRQAKVEENYQGRTAIETRDLAEIRRLYPGDIIKFAQQIEIYLGDKTTLRPILSVKVYVNTDGIWTGMSVETAHRSVAGTEELRGVAMTTTYPLFFALSLMHCKNVHHEPLPFSEKLRKARERRGKFVADWRHIVVDSLRKSITAGEHGQGNSVKLAFRLARGHFKDYREGRGLFGKIHGRFWWDNYAGTGDGPRASYSVKAPGPQS